MKKYGIANTNEFGLIKGNKYIIETAELGTVYVYDLSNNYLTYCRLDSFDNIIDNENEIIIRKES